MINIRLQKIKDMLADNQETPAEDKSMHVLEETWTDQAYADLLQAYFDLLQAYADLLQVCFDLLKSYAYLLEAYFDLLQA